MIEVTVACVQCALDVLQSQQPEVLVVQVAAGGQLVLEVLCQFALKPGKQGTGVRHHVEEEEARKQIAQLVRHL